MKEGNFYRNSLELLRFPLATIVVVVHAFSSQGPVSLYENLNLELFKGFGLFVEAFLRGISVPVYFFISGFFFFNNIISFDKTVYYSKLRNRIKTLLIPYLIWNTVAIFLVLVKQLPIFTDYLTYHDSGLNINLINILSCYIADNGQLSPPPGSVRVPISPFPINTALWFIRDLMVVVITTPIIYKLIVKFESLFLALLAIVYVSVKMFIPSFGMLATAYFFFSLGAYVSIRKIDIAVMLRPYFKASIVIYCILGVVYLFAINNISSLAKFVKILNTFVGLGLLLNLSFYLIEHNHKVNSFLASSSVFIYMTHCLIIHRMTKILLHVCKPEAELSIILVFVVSAALTILILLLSYYILKNKFPDCLRVITGRR